MEQIMETNPASPATHLEKIDRSLSGFFRAPTIAAGANNSAVTIIDAPADSEESEIATIKADAAFARQNIYTLVQQGQDALEYAVDLAKQADSPKMFESVAVLLKAMGDINMQILETHEKKQKLTGKLAPTETVVNNSVVFNGTTAQLNEMLKSALTNKQ